MSNPTKIKHSGTLRLNSQSGFYQSYSFYLSPLSAFLAVLESWLDHSGELEPPDPLSRLPQLKQRIRRLLCDLCTVRRLSVWH